jgi:SPX domain protein involved in polyphosphate accumulation
MNDSFEYTVRSIYFDNRDFDFYNDKLEGLDIRKKVRIRGYNRVEEGDEIVFLEVKKKFGMGIEKKRAPVLFKDVENLLSSGDVERYVIDDLKGFKNSIQDAREFIYNLYRKNLTPKILVIYEREAYQDKKSGEFRITFDKNLRSWVYPNINELFVERDIIYSYADSFIIEAKFRQDLPLWFKFMIDKFSLKQVSFSKYVICTDSHGIVGYKNKKFV